MIIKFTTKYNNEYYSSAFEDLNDAISYLDNMKDDEALYVDDFFNQRRKLDKKEICTVGLTAEEMFIDDGDVDRKIAQIPTVDQMDINPDWMHINDETESNIINLDNYKIKL